MRRCAVAAEGGEMLFGAVTLVLAPGIDGECLVQRGHHPVARDLGDNRGGGYRGGASVAADERVAGAGKGRRVVAVDECENRRMRQRTYGARHGKMGRLTDIDEIDLLHARFAYADRKRHRHDRDVGFLARRFAHYLRIVESPRHAALLEDDGSGHHGPRQRTTARFVHARNRSAHLRKDARLENVMRHTSPLEEGELLAKLRRPLKLVENERM